VQTEALPRSSNILLAKPAWQRPEQRHPLPARAQMAVTAMLQTSSAGYQPPSIALKVITKGLKPAVARSHQALVASGRPLSECPLHHSCPYLTWTIMLSLDAASWASFTQRLTTSKLHFSRCCGQQGISWGWQECLPIPHHTPGLDLPTILVLRP
jgi:hypothetical protein